MKEDLRKERTLTIQMEDDDFKLVYLAAGKAGMTPGELVAAFLNDLVDGAYTNGSDERMYAQSWYDRCGFTYGPSMTFTQYLLEVGELEDFMADRNEMQKALDDVQWFSQKIADESNQLHRVLREGMELERFAAQDDADERLAWMKERWNDYQRACPYGEKDYEAAVLAAVSWHEGMAL